MVDQEVNLPATWKYLGAGKIKREKEKRKGSLHFPEWAYSPVAINVSPKRALKNLNLLNLLNPLNLFSLGA